MPTTQTLSFPKEAFLERGFEEDKRNFTVGKQNVKTIRTFPRNVAVFIIIH